MLHSYWVSVNNNGSGLFILFTNVDTYMTVWFGCAIFDTFGIISQPHKLGFHYHLLCWNIGNKIRSKSFSINSKSSNIKKGFAITSWIWKTLFYGYSILYLLISRHEKNCELCEPGLRIFLRKVWIFLVN
jgi:hypothetical protein